MAIVDLTNDVLPFLGKSADDSFGRINTVMEYCEQYAETYCDRLFEETTYKEVEYNYRGGSVSVKNFPITSVSRVTSNLDTVLTVTNTNEFTTATVEINDAAVILTHNGVSTTITFAAQTTISAMNTAINAVAGWTSAISGDTGTVLTTSLVNQFPQDAINSTSVTIGILGSGIPYDVINLDAGIIEPRSTHYGFQSSYSDQDCTVGRFGSYRTNNRNLYVTYSAGYSVANMPQDLKDAILFMIQYAYNKLINEEIGIKSTNIIGMAKAFEGAGVNVWPLEVISVFDRYKRYTV